MKRETLLCLIRSAVLPECQAIPSNESIDWRGLIDEAERQGVAVIASDGLQRLYDSGLYVAHDDKALRLMKASWFGETITYEQRYARQLADAEKLGRVWAKAGIRTIVLKGFTVSACYPYPSHRFCADFDCFLVKDGEHMNAYEDGNRVMEGLGIQVNRDHYKNSAFDFRGLRVENHKFCSQFRGNKQLLRLEKLLQGELLAGAESSIGETGLFAPPPMFSALFMVVHAYFHFLHEGLNLRHALDWVMFRRFHATDVDWKVIDDRCREFGFSRFLSSLDAIGEYVLGAKPLEDLTTNDRRLLEDMWKGPVLHGKRRGLGLRFSIADHTLRAAWKYRLFSPISMVHALWIQIKGYFFIKHPTLS